jgi:hypothetical protein
MTFLENIKETIKKIAQVLKTKADKTEIVQSDWAQTDINDKSFIKNKPDTSSRYPITFNNLLESVKDLDSNYWTLSGAESIEGQLKIPPKTKATLYYNLSKLPIVGNVDLSKLRVRLNYSGFQGVIFKFRDVTSNQEDFFMEADLDLSIPTGWTKGLIFEFENTTTGTRFLSLYEISVFSYDPTVVTTRAFTRNTVEKQKSTDPSKDYQHITYSEAGTYIYSTNNLTLPDYFTTFHYVMSDGVSVTFDGHPNLFSPEGRVLNKRGSYAVLVKAKDRFILRINKPA